MAFYQSHLQGFLHKCPTPKMIILTWTCNPWNNTMGLSLGIRYYGCSKWASQQFGQKWPYTKMAKFLISDFGFLWFSGLLNESRNVLKHFTPYYHGKVTFPSFKWKIILNAYGTYACILFSFVFNFSFHCSVCLWYSYYCFWCFGLLFANHLSNKHS